MLEYNSILGTFRPFFIKTKQICEVTVIWRRTEKLSTTTTIKQQIHQNNQEIQRAIRRCLRCNLMDFEPEWYLFSLCVTRRCVRLLVCCLAALIPPLPFPFPLSFPPLPAKQQSTSKWQLQCVNKLSKCANAELMMVMN